MTVQLSSFTHYTEPEHHNAQRRRYIDRQTTVSCRYSRSYCVHQYDRQKRETNDV